VLANDTTLNNNNLILLKTKLDELGINAESFEILQNTFGDIDIEIEKAFNLYEWGTIIKNIEADFGFKINDIIDDDDVKQAFLQAIYVKNNGVADIIQKHNITSKDKHGIVKTYNLFDGFDLSLYEINELAMAIKFNNKESIQNILKNNNPKMYSDLDYDTFSNTAQFESNIYELSILLEKIKPLDSPNPKCNIGKVNSSDLILDCPDEKLITRIERGAQYSPKGKTNTYNTDVLLKSNLVTEEAIIALKQSGIDLSSATEKSPFPITGKTIDYHIGNIIEKYEQYGISSLTNREIHAITDYCKNLYKNNNSYKNTMDQLCDKNQNIDNLRSRLAAIRKELDTKLSGSSLAVEDHFIGRVVDRNYLKICTLSNDDFGKFIQEIKQHNDVKKLGDGSQCDITVNIGKDPIRIKIEKNNNKLVLVTII